MLDRRGRRHGRRHRVAAVPRGDPPAPRRARRAELGQRAPHARAVHRARPASSRPSRRSTRSRSCARSASSPTCSSCRSEQTLPERRDQEDRDVLQRRRRTRCSSRSTSTRIYELPLMLPRARASTRSSPSCSTSGRARRELTAWERVVAAHQRARSARSTIGFVGKYVDLVESYKSLNEALLHGGIAQRLPRRASRTSTPRRSRSAAPATLAGVRRHPGGARLRRARHRGQDRRGPLRARAAGAVLRHLLRHADGGASSSRATCAASSGANSTEIDPHDAAPGGRPDARPARRHRQGRDDAARRVSVRAQARHARRRRRTARPRSASATATATRSTTTTATRSSATAWCCRGCRPTAGWSR